VPGERRLNGLSYTFDTKPITASNERSSKVPVSMTAYNALMTSSRQHDIIVLLMIWLLSILAGLMLGLTWLML
jgi:hypothetical protein